MIVLTLIKKIRGGKVDIQSNKKVPRAKVLWVAIIMFGFFQTVHAQKKPTWVNEFPNSPQYYIGVGSAVISENDTEY